MENPRKIIRPISIVPDEEREKKKAPELRMYLICYSFLDGTRDWVEVEGRTVTYDSVKTMIESGNVNVEESIILVEGGEYGKHATLYQFMKHMENFYNNKFDIDDYVVGDSEDEASNVSYGNDYNVQPQIGVTSDYNSEGEDV